MGRLPQESELGEKRAAEECPHYILGEVLEADPKNMRIYRCDQAYEDAP